MRSSPNISLIRTRPQFFHFYAPFLTGPGSFLKGDQTHFERHQLAEVDAENISVELSHTAAIIELVALSMQQSVVDIHARGCMSSVKVTHGRRWRMRVGVVVMPNQQPSLGKNQEYKRAPGEQRRGNACYSLAAYISST